MLKRFEEVLLELSYVFNRYEKQISRFMFYMSLVCFCYVIFHVGYLERKQLKVYYSYEIILKGVFYFLAVLNGLFLTVSVIGYKRLRIPHYASLFVFVYFFLVALGRNSNIDLLEFFKGPEWIYVGVAIIFVAELSKNSLLFDNFYFNPTILFIISYLMLIFIGSGLLMLPRASSHGISLSFIDAMFMSTSAVSITGLTVVDVSSQLSFYGKFVIMVLMQVGGLGIMTFTGFFGYFFSGGFSFKNQLMYGEILGETKLGSVVSTLLKIIFITFLFEIIGGVLIFISLEDYTFNSVGEKVFFAAFHSISAFCNAGFTTIDGGMTNTLFRHNYGLQLALTFTLIFGGLGFSLVNNTYIYFKTKLTALVKRFVLNKQHIHKPQVFSFNSKFILTCNLLVIAAATLFFLIFQYDGALLEDESLFGKFSASFFMANSARSTGFNNMHVATLGAPTLLLFSVLMWIGASPGSTGGGVKVTTVAIAVLNVFSLAKGKENIELYKRKIMHESVQKAFAIIVLSFVAIGISFLLLVITNPHLSSKTLIFESISAYCTCGLSLGASQDLNSAGKIILVVTMFVGRVGLLTIIVALIKDTKSRTYKYPTEKIMF